MDIFFSESFIIICDENNILTLTITMKGAIIV